MPIPTLETDRLTLRPFHAGDALDVQRLAGAREVASGTLDIPFPYPDGGAEQWIATHGPSWDEGVALSLAVTEPTVGLVGAVSLRLTLEHRRGELGYWVGVPFWNRGYATEAAAAVLDFGFARLKLIRIEAKHFIRNPASGRVMEKLGMTREGVSRKYFMRWGEAEDTAVWAMVSDDEPVDGGSRVERGEAG